jgi:hypothetical protein
MAASPVAMVSCVLKTEVKLAVRIPGSLDSQSVKSLTRCLVMHSAIAITSLVLRLR